MGEHHTEHVSFSRFKKMLFLQRFYVQSYVNFVVYESEVSMYGTEYDFESITHYPSTAFSSNGNPTLVSKEPGGDKIMVRLS